MSKIPSVSSRQIIQALRKAGFQDAPKRGKGSHTALMRRDEENVVRLVIVPQGKDVPKGTLHAILAQAGISRDEFLSLL